MKVFIVAALFALVAADIPTYRSNYPKPTYPGYPTAAYPKPSYPAPAHPASYPATYSKSYDYPAMPYTFAWAVKDYESYNDYSHQESGDDKDYVAGSYRVLLPDGRTQVVNYKAGGYTGYLADVAYEGEAKYDYKPAYSKPSYPTRHQ